jgi:hypothetical protein
MLAVQTAVGIQSAQQLRDVLAWVALFNLLQIEGGPPKSLTQGLLAF